MSGQRCSLFSLVPGRTQSSQKNYSCLIKRKQPHVQTLSFGLQFICAAAKRCKVIVFKLLNTWSLYGDDPVGEDGAVWSRFERAETAHTEENSYYIGWLAAQRVCVSLRSQAQHCWRVTHTHTHRNPELRPQRRGVCCTLYPHRRADYNMQLLTEASFFLFENTLSEKKSAILNQLSRQENHLIELFSDHIEPLVTKRTIETVLFKKNMFLQKRVLPDLNGFCLESFCRGFSCKVKWFYRAQFFPPGR